MRTCAKSDHFCPPVSQVCQFVSPVKNFEISIFTGLNNRSGYWHRKNRWQYLPLNDYCHRRVAHRATEWLLPRTLAFPQAFVWWQWTFTDVSRRCMDAASFPGLSPPPVNFWSLAKTGGRQGLRTRLMQIPHHLQVVWLYYCRICPALHLHFRFWLK